MILIKNYPKTKPWINKETLILMKKRDKLLYKYSKYKLKNSQLAITIYNEYKLIRNQVTKLKRDNKLDYYKKFFNTINLKCQPSGKA